MLIFKAPLHVLRKTKGFKYLINSKWNHPKLCNIGFNHKVALRPLTHASIRWGRSRLEPIIRRLITEIAIELDLQKNNGFFFDIGANIGLYTWEIRRVCPNRKILAFEPDPKNFELLETTTTAGDLQNIELYPVALSDKDRVDSFFQDTLTSATGSLSETNKPWIEQYLNEYSPKIMVRCKTMDSMMAVNKIPSLVKIDVEGHEIEVLQGSEKILSSAKPLIIIESFPPNRETTSNLLLEYGYELLDADTCRPVNKKTHNLLAWHPSGPLKSTFIKKLVSP